MFSRGNSRYRGSGGGPWIVIIVILVAIIIGGGILFASGDDLLSKLPFIGGDGSASSSDSSSSDDGSVSAFGGMSSQEEHKTTIVVDPGHGGADPGTSGSDGITAEKDVTLPIAEKLKAKLEAQDYVVIMTRTDDIKVSLEDRSTMANEADADLFISIHCNAFEDPNVSGLECYYSNSEPGKEFAELVYKQAVAAGIKTRSYKEEDYHVCRETNMPATLVETGFLTCPDELALLTSDEYQEKLAECMFQGIQEMLQQMEAHPEQYAEVHPTAPDMGGEGTEGGTSTDSSASGGENAGGETTPSDGGAGQPGAGVLGGNNTP